MIDFYIGLGTGLLFGAFIEFMMHMAEKIVMKRLGRDKTINYPKKKESLKEDKPEPEEIETAINNIMNYNEDVALYDIKKRKMR